MNIQMNEDPLARNAQGFSKSYHEVLLLLKFLHTKPLVKNMNFRNYCSYYTVIKNRDEKQVVGNQYENDYNNFDDIVPNHYIGRKKILKK